MTTQNQAVYPGRWVKYLQGERLKTHRVVRTVCAPGGGIWNKPVMRVSYRPVEGSNRNMASDYENERQLQLGKQAAKKMKGALIKIFGSCSLIFVGMVGVIVVIAMILNSC